MAVARHGGREGHISGLAGTWPGWCGWCRGHRASQNERRQYLRVRTARSVQRGDAEAS